MKMSVIHYCLWLQLVSCAVSSRVSVEPSVQTVAVGQNATLVCSTPINKSIDWKFKKPGANRARMIILNSEMDKYYKSKYIPYTDVAGNHVLVITNVQIDDIGRYSCADDEGFGEAASAEVNVVDIVPQNRDTPRPRLQLSTDVSTREPLISDPETEVGTTTITLIIAVPALVILIILAVVMLRRSYLSKASEKTCCCYSRTDNPTTTEDYLMQKSDCHGKVQL